MLDKRIKFDARYDEEESEITHLFFIAPKEKLTELGYEYPDAVSMKISIEFPLYCITSEDALVSISPTDADGDNYDWIDIYLPYDEIDEFIKLAECEK